ncbi:hypothetical protein M885DRAFT_606811, partial [Pelagophyceae sp. CCMP2097]
MRSWAAHAAPVLWHRRTSRSDSATAGRQCCSRRDSRLRPGCSAFLTWWRRAVAARAKTRARFRRSSQRLPRRTDSRSTRAAFFGRARPGPTKRSALAVHRTARTARATTRRAHEKSRDVRSCDAQFVRSRRIGRRRLPSWNLRAFIACSPPSTWASPTGLLQGCATTTTPIPSARALSSTSSGERRSESGKSLFGATTRASSPRTVSRTWRTTSPTRCTISQTGSNCSLTRLASTETKTFRAAAAAARRRRRRKRKRRRRSPVPQTGQEDPWRLSSDCVPRGTSASAAQLLDGTPALGGHTPAPVTGRVLGRLYARAAGPRTQRTLSARASAVQTVRTAWTARAGPAQRVRRRRPAARGAATAALRDARAGA